MMSDASDMLAAALEQMDGIIAGKVLSQIQKSGLCAGNKGIYCEEKVLVHSHFVFVTLKEACFVYRGSRVSSTVCQHISSLRIEAATLGSFPPFAVFLKYVVVSHVFYGLLQS